MRFWTIIFVFLTGLSSNLQGASACKTCTLSGDGNLVCYDNYVEVCNEPIKPVTTISTADRNRPDPSFYGGGSGGVYSASNDKYNSGWITLDSPIDAPKPQSPYWNDGREDANRWRQQREEWERAQSSERERRQQEAERDASARREADIAQREARNQAAFDAMRAEQARMMQEVVERQKTARESYNNLVSISMDLDGALEKASKEFNRDFIEAGILSDHASQLADLVTQVNTARSDGASRIAVAKQAVEGLTVTPVDGFLSHQESLEGQAVRRASAYVSLAKESVEKSSADGKVPAALLVREATQVLSTADKAYADGMKEEGDYGIRLVYHLTDAALALAPVAVVLAAPEAIVVLTAVSAVSIAKDYYEFRSGKRLFTGEALSGLDQYMSGMGVVLGMVPAFGASVGRAMTLGGEALEYAKGTRLAAFFARAGAGAQEAQKVTEAEQAVKGVFDSAKEIGATTSEMMQDFTKWLKKPLAPNPERGAIGNSIDKTLEIIKDLRPEKAAIEGSKLFEDVPKTLRSNVWDIMENLPQALKDNQQAKGFINTLRPHEMTANYKGWTSLDLVPNNPSASPLRFLYKAEADGTIKWMIKDTH